MERVSGVIGVGGERDWFAGELCLNAECGEVLEMVRESGLQPAVLGVRACDRLEAGVWRKYVGEVRAGLGASRCWRLRRGFLRSYSRRRDPGDICAEISFARVC